jgi:secreted trypsin-like serine protease
MKFQVLIWFAIIAAVLSNSTHQKRARRQFIEHQKQKHRERIFGGVEAPPNSIPFIVFLFTSFENAAAQCGGALISEWIVLTAAHCLIAEGQDLLEILGMHT